MRLLLAALLALAPAIAWGQAVPLQGGPWTPGHVPQYVGQGSQQPVISDGGSAAGGAIGANASELGIVARGTGTAPYSGQGTGAFGSIACAYDAPITNSTGYHFLCLSPNATTGTGLISYGAGGTATPGSLQFNINGSLYNFPPTGSGTGNVNGPVSSTVGHIATWNNTGGTLLADTTQIALGNLPTIGANTALGSIAGGTPIALTTTQLTTLCNAFTSSLSGCVPLSGGGTANFLRADGTWAAPGGLTVGVSTISGGTTQQLLFNSAGLVGEVAKCNSGVYITSAAGVPSCSQTIPSATQANITTVGTLTSGTWNGTAVAGLYGGTGLSTAAIGDIMYASATTPTWARLADVATGSVLVSGGVNTAPAWSASPTLTSLTVPSILSPTVQFGSGAGVPAHLASGQTTAPAINSCSTGAVTAGSTDTIGKVTATGATTCSITWNVPYNTAPFCLVQDDTVNGRAIVPTPSTSGLSVAGLTAADVFTYICIAQSGG